MPLLRHWIKKQHKKKKRALVSSTTTASAQQQAVYSDAVDSDAPPADSLPPSSSVKRNQKKRDSVNLNQGSPAKDSSNVRQNNTPSKKEKHKVVQYADYYKTGSESDSESNRESTFEVSTGRRRPQSSSLKNSLGVSGSNESLDHSRAPSSRKKEKGKDQEQDKEEKQRLALLSVLKGPFAATAVQALETKEPKKATSSSSSNKKKKSPTTTAITTTNVEAQSSQIGFVPTGILKRRASPPSTEMTKEQPTKGKSGKSGKVNPLLCFKFDMARILAAMD
jgi:hypothetical protein